MADTKVGILVEAKNNASATLKTVQGDLRGLGKEAGSVDSLSSALGSLGKVAGVVSAAFGAIQVGQAVVELAKVGAEAQRLEASYNTLTSQAGISGDALLSAMQKASSGTIANTDLMLTANRALALGVADSASEISQLMEVAITRGKALGLSSTQAFNDLVTGIGRISPLILDNLGIVTGGEKVFNDYAASIGKTGDALSDAERKQALVNKVIAESQGLIQANAAAGNDAASSFERAAASFQNIKADLGELFGPAIAAFADSLARAVDSAAGAISNVGATLDLNSAIGNVEIFQAAIQRSNSELNQYRDFLSQLTVGSQEYADQQKVISAAELQLTQNKRNLQQAQAAYFETLRQTYPAQVQTADAMNRTSVEAQAMAQALAAGSAGMFNQSAAAANLGGSLAVLGGHYQNVIALQNVFAGQTAGLSAIAGQVIGAAGEEEGLKFLRQTTAELSLQQQAWSESGYTVAEVNALSIAYNDTLRKTTEETYGYGSAAVKANKAAAAAVKAVNAEYEDLKSKVSGVLSGALGDIGGVNLDEILPRTDSVSEDARRLADVAVNGFASPWADYLANKFPDTIGAAFAGGGDIKQVAAGLLKDFQDGLRPELLDKNKAKELVKRAIVGEQNLKALTDEIAKELANELGISVAQAQAAATSALGGGTVTGGASGATPAKTVPIIPTIDTSKLPTTPLLLEATIDRIIILESAKNPQITSTAAIGELVIAEGAKVPRPVIPGGLWIESADLRSDAKLPDVVLPATITTLLLSPSVVNPQIKSTAAVDFIVISEKAKPPTVSLPGGAFIRDVVVSSTAVLPIVALTGTVAPLSVIQNAVTETPLALTAKVTPQIDTSGISAEQKIAASTFITETLPVIVVPQISTVGIVTSVALEYLESELAPIVTPSINYLGVPFENLVAAGTWIADGMKTGITQSNIGSAIVTSLNNSQELIKGSGKTSGANWGSGFLETVGQNVPSALVNLLVTLVTPGVQDAINNSGTKTGAQG